MTEIRIYNHELVFRFYIMLTRDRLRITSEPSVLNVFYCFPNRPCVGFGKYSVGNSPMNSDCRKILFVVFEKFSRLILYIIFIVRYLLFLGRIENFHNLIETRPLFFEFFLLRKRFNRHFLLRGKICFQFGKPFFPRVQTFVEF